MISLNGTAKSNRWSNFVYGAHVKCHLFCVGLLFGLESILCFYIKIK
jgi:hypothetical protein